WRCSRRSTPCWASRRGPVGRSAFVAQALECRVDFLAGTLARCHLLLLDLQVDLLAEHRDVPRRLDSDPDLLAHDRQHRNLDVVADHDALVRLPGEYQHVWNRLPARLDQRTRTSGAGRPVRPRAEHTGSNRHSSTVFRQRSSEPSARRPSAPLSLRPDGCISLRIMPRRSLRPELNRIRAWVRQGRTDAWIAHQLEVTVQQIQAFKREHDLDEGSQTNGENA